MSHGAEVKASLPHWTGRFTRAGIEYEYTMVGTDPAQGSATTVIPTELICLRLVFPNGIVLDPCTDLYKGTTVVASVLNSPIFQNANFSSQNTSLGLTQFTDAYQRANFWTYVSTTSPNYHVLLGPPQVFTQTLTVPVGSGSAGPPEPGSNQILGKVDIDWIDHQVLQMLTSLNIDPRSLPIFLIHNTVFSFGGSIAALGYHDFAPNSTQSDGQAYINSCFIDENLSPSLLGDEADVLTLSHEVGEWLADPFVNNLVPTWQYPDVPSSCLEDFLLEVADPVESPVFQRIVMSLNGMTYHLQDLVFLAWFAGTTPSNAVNGFYSLADTVHSASQSCASRSTTVQFDSSNYAVNEDAGTVSVRVVRSGDTSGAVKVEFATSDGAGSQSCDVKTGIASARCDYEERVATISFSPGETSKTVSIFVVDDSFQEGNETFNVNLSNPVGASLGAAATATVTIIDNDNTNGANAIDSASYFVRAHYFDFLNRDADQSGLDFWTNQLVSCGSDQACLQARRVTVSAAFYVSIEFQQTGYLVERIYKAAYGDTTRSSTFGGAHQLAVPTVRLIDFLHDTQEIGQGVVVNQTGWEQILESNKQAFTQEFVTRLRFQAAFPTSLTPAQFVDALFSNAGVTPAASDRKGAIDEFGPVATTPDIAARGRVLRRVAENPILAGNEFNRAFVLMQYFGYLHRNPGDPPDVDYSGYEFWLAKLNQFNGDFVQAEMVKAFISSTEYRRRFGAN